MSKKSRIWLGVAIAVVILGAVAAVAVRRESRKAVSVQTENASRRDLVSMVTASGEVKPQKFVNISANVSGRITHLLVQEGDRVKKGQVLARIDSTRFEADTNQSFAAVQAQKAELDRAVADLDVSRLVFDRTKKMHEERLVADQQFDQAAAEIRMKEANVESMKRRIDQSAAALASSRDNLEKTTVASPMDGVVTNLAKEEGEVVIGAQSFQPTVIMTVADLSVMECEVLVDETDIRNLQLGQSADIRVDALEGTKIQGKVTEIGSSAIPRGQSSSGSPITTSSSSTANQAKDFKVKITIQDPPPALRPGLNATADITTARKEKVLAVPIQAVVARAIDKDGKVLEPGEEEPRGSGTAGANTVSTIKARLEEKEGVFLVQTGKAQFRPVKTGIVGDTDIEITEGVSEGDEIVTGSYKTLRTLKNDARVKKEKKRAREQA